MGWAELLITLFVGSCFGAFAVWFAWDIADFRRWKAKNDADWKRVKAKLKARLDASPPREGGGNP